MKATVGLAAVLLSSSCIDNSHFVYLDLGHTTVVAEPGTVTANGNDRSVVTFTLSREDIHLDGVRMVFSVHPNGAASLDPPEEVSDLNGQASVMVSSTVVGDCQIGATGGGGNARQSPIPATATVHFVAP